MRYLHLLAFLLLAPLALTACGTAEDVVEETDDVAADAYDAAEDVASSAYDTVTDAAGNTYDAATDVFEDDEQAQQVALIRPTTAPDAEVQGTVALHETNDALRVRVSLRDLAPGAHGIHIHQNGECGPRNGTPGGEAGPHWDPHNTNNHGAPSDDPDSGKHLGDLGNIEVGADGMVETTFVVDAYRPGEHSLEDHAIIVHEQRDNLETDPGGSSGTRMGCGVLTARSD